MIWPTRPPVIRTAWAMWNMGRSPNLAVALFDGEGSRHDNDGHDQDNGNGIHVQPPFASAACLNGCILSEICLANTCVLFEFYK